MNKKKFGSFYCHDEFLDLDLDYIVHVLDKKHVDMLCVWFGVIEIVRHGPTTTTTKKLIAKK